LAPNLGHDLVILHDLLDSSVELADLVRKNGYTTKFMSFVAFAREERNVREMKAPILIAQVTGAENEVRRRLMDMIQRKHLQSYPMIVIGPGVNHFTDLVNNFFKAAITLPTPYTEEAVLGAIELMDSILNRLLREGSASLAVSEERETEVIEVPDLRVISGTFNDHSLYQAMIPKILGGREYTLAKDRASFQDRSYLPRSPDTLNAIKKMEEVGAEWSTNRLHRSAFVSHNMLKSLDIDESVVESCRAAAFLYAWSLGEGSKDLLRVDLLSPHSGAAIIKLQGKIQESSDWVVTSLDQPQIGKILDKFARLIGRKVVETDDRDGVAAHCILAAEMIDRSCWQMGVWNPGAAYRLLKKCKHGELNGISPAIVCCVIKVLLEAVESTLPNRLLPRVISENQSLKDRAGQQRSLQIDDYERRVAISALEPGMQLTRPLIAFDGKTIIPQDVVLDQDIIWRIWSLCAVRSLNTPLIIRIEQTKNESIAATEIAINSGTWTRTNGDDRELSRQS